MSKDIRRMIMVVALLALFVGQVCATKITFDGAAANANDDIPFTYGSYIAGNSTGFVTTDGSGATPHIGLNWVGNLPNEWEYHNGPFWHHETPVNVAQMDFNRGGPYDDIAEIVFNPIDGRSVKINSFLLTGADDRDLPATFHWQVVGTAVGGDVTVYPYLVGTPDTVTVPVNYTGSPGLSQTLRFTLVTGNDNAIGTVLDDLSFSEVLAPGAPLFKLTVDRATGGITLSNAGTTAQTIKGYTISSEAGALNYSGWKAISGNYDVNGNGSVDSNDNWTKLTQAGNSNELTEYEFGGDGATVGAGNAVVLSQAGGNAWLKSPFEELALDLILADGNIYKYTVEYINGPAGGFAVGDLNFDGSVNALDWPTYNAGRGVDMSGMSAVEAYRKGDLDGDMDNDIADFVLFKQLVTGGLSAFGIVPEPSAVGLLLLGCMILCVRRSVNGSVYSETTNSSRNPVKTLCALLMGIMTLYGLGLNRSHATTIGFVGAAAVNADIPLNYGSNISSDGAGWTVSDGTGATPNVALYWGGAPDSTGWDWEFHNAVTFQHLEALHSGGSWDALAPPSNNGVVQLQHQTGAPHAIKFSVPSGVSLVLNSFDIGNATDQSAAEGPYGFDIALIRDSDSTQVWSHHTPEFNAGQQESVPVNYTGGLGLSYTLTFTRHGQGSGVTWRSGLDNLSFSEGALTAPLKLVVSTTTGLVELQNQSGQSYTIDSYEITSDSNSLDPASWVSLQDSDYEGNGVPGTGNGWEEAGGVNAGQLIESYLLGSSTIAHGASIVLGQAFDFDKVGMQQDLQFGYHIPGDGGFLTVGDVEYVSPVVDADFNNDGTINGKDFLIWQRGYGLTGAAATNAKGNADGDSDVDRVDLAIWQAKYGTVPSLAANIAVPEPTTGCLLLVAGLGCITGIGRARRRLGVAVSLPTRSTWWTGLMGTMCVTLVAQSALASKTNDRRYEFGDGGTSNMQDSQFISSDDKQDLAVPSGSGSPTFANVSSTGLNRPGAATGDKGAQFDGVDDVLTGVPLNRPDETAGPDFVGIGPLLFPFPYNYNSITTRGLQMWVYPDASAIGTGRQGIVFDTIGAGGVAISADGKWTQAFAEQVTDNAIKGTVPVVGNQWYHVMQHIYHAAQPGFPAPESNARTNTAVVYVNGAAVSASNGTTYPGQLDNGDRAGVLAVGAEEISGDGFTPVFDNHFKGVVDDLQMYVYGDNSSDPGFPSGQDYGTFNLFSDNDWIAARIAAIPGGVLKTGDINRDGSVNDSDVTPLVANWKKEKRFVGAINEILVGDWETWGWGDLNTDGVVDLHDAIILDQSLISAGFTAGLNFNLLGTAVPEPASLIGGLLGMVVLATQRRRR